MKLTPLVIAAAYRIPALTDTFSDLLDVASMTVTASGNTVIACNTPHNLPIGPTTISVIDALTPNPITALEKKPNGDVLVTVTYPHVLSTTPDPVNFDPWDTIARLQGIGIGALTGSVQLVSVESTTSFIVRPGVDVTPPDPVPDGSILLERLEHDIIGWQTATVTSATSLTFPTPASVTRSYAVSSPKIATNIRVAGAMDIGAVLRAYARDDEADAPRLDRGWMFVIPQRRAIMSRDRTARSDANSEITPGSVVRQLLVDGFEIMVVLPAERYGGGIACVDRANGQILTAVLKTFNGIVLPFSELDSPNPFVAMIKSHGIETYNRANYIHSYQFEVTAYITSGDTVSGIDHIDLGAIDLAIQNGTPLPTSLPPIGSVPFSDFVLQPSPLGLFTDKGPQPLNANATIPPNGGPAP